MSSTRRVCVPQRSPSPLQLLVPQMGFAPLSPSYDVKECKMPLPQDIRPVFQDIQATLVLSDAPWIERSPKDKLKVLWIGRETGTWASLHHWKKGYAAPPHKHLAGAHAYIMSGKQQVRTCPLKAGGHIYEPPGVLPDETNEIEATTYRFISKGPVLLFD